MRRVGVHLESITLDDAATAFDLNREWNDAHKESVGKMIDQVYGKFLSLVAESRKMKVDKVKGLAGGRVWSGTQAKANGLVDEIGGLDDCLAYLAKKASLKEVKTVHRPEAKSGLDLMDLLGGNEPDEIYHSLPWKSLAPLRSRGFSLRGTMMLLQESLQQQ